MTIEAGDKAPNFNLPRDGGATLSLSELKGKKFVLFFYPKDDTSGCTKEAEAFRDRIKRFETLGATVVGLSKDSVAKHDKFKAKYNLPFPLLADEDCKVCEAYGVWKEKSMYGKKYMGIERSTFIIDEVGTVRNVWRKVKVNGHADEVLDALMALS